MAAKKLAYPVRPGEKVCLTDYDPRSHPDGLTKEDASARMETLGAEFAEAQELLYGASGASLLVILQGMDTSGKDGATKRVFAPINPSGCNVVSFKAPTALELAHDFLWRVHPHAPARGMIAVFNRSHYEDVLITRVHGIVPEKIWRARYTQINAFESLRAANSTIICKFFLHISKEEQEARLLAREADPLKGWKLDPADWRERERWDDYQHAYEDALRECSTADAPWYIVPADRKWVRDLAITETLVAALRPHLPAWRESLAARSAVQRAAVEQYRAEKSSR